MVLLQSCGRRVLRRGAVIRRETFAIPRSAATVWRDLTGEDSWYRALARITWITPPPHDVGAIRVARSRGGLSVIKERFFRWEEARRMAFYVTEASLPFFRRFAEDYRLEPTGESSCKLTWTIAIEPTPLGRLATPMNLLLVRSLFRDTRRHFGLPV